MIAARKPHPASLNSAMLWLCAALAVAVHGALLFAWKYAPEESAAAIIEGDSVEVALVESAPAASAIAEPQPPVVQPQAVPEPATLPEPTPPPEPLKTEPEMTLPEPPKPKPTPRPASAATPLPKTTPRPATTRNNLPPKNSAAAATAGGASSPAGTSATGAGTGKNAKASYVLRPIATYPPESRAAGEHGVVILRLTVDGNGRPTTVSIAKSSGFPRLDRAAVEAGWRCRVRDAIPGSHLDAPVRFNLSNR